ncbi:MAG TPA: spore germination protein GerW family protein [Spirochaetia bacterium]|nr:spore germination protein GerW family protein [Spirochaetia bacterium]
MFKENIEAVVSRLENLITTKTIVGEPIVSGNVTIIPVMSAAFGFGLGSGENNDTAKCGGKGSGGGAGGRIKPVALVVLQEGEVKVYSLAQKGTLEKLAEVVPEVLARFGKQQKETE